MPMLAEHKILFGQNAISTLEPGVTGLTFLHGTSKGMLSVNVWNLRFNYFIT
jgi:hypothetical protein